jgi:peptide/nickel transport system ATP-binding protein
LFEGRDLLKLPESELRKIRGREIAYIYQDPSSALDPLYTIGYQIAETITIHNPIIKLKNALKKAVHVLREVSIPDPDKRVRNYPHELSGGMKQRVVIGISTVNKPKLIIADEPTTALDVTTQAQIMDLLVKLKKKYNTTVILITHNLGLVAEVSDRVMVMYAGKVVEIADVYELFEKPLHPGQH